MAEKFKLSETMGNVGAALQGRLPEHQQMKLMEQEAQMAREQQLMALDQQRRQALVEDSRAGLRLLQQGNVGAFMELGNDRVNRIRQLKGDPTDTLGILQLVQSGNIQGAMQELQTVVDMADAYAQQQAPQILDANQYKDGQIAMFDPNTGQARAVPVEGYQAPVEKPNYNQPFNADGSPNPAFQEYELNRSRARGTNVTVDNTEGSPEFNKLVDQQLAAALDTASVSASATPQLAMLEQLAPITSQGRIPEALSKMFPTYNEANTAYIGLVNQVLPSLKAPGSGAQSDRDIDVLQQSIGTLAASPDTKVLLIKAMQEKNQINQQLADIAESYAEGSITRAEAVRRKRVINSRSVISEPLRNALSRVQGTGGNTVFDEADAILNGTP